MKRRKTYLGGKKNIFQKENKKESNPILGIIINPSNLY